MAAALARDLDAVAFLASASSGVQRPEQFPTHTSASLIVRHGLDHRALPARADQDTTFLVQVL